jgi:tRNA-Thr(GGU) m(6)t(6)A37 methyltransferase TsaA
MADDSDIREGEIKVDAPPPRDAGLVFIGLIRTPWASRDDTPRQGSFEGPVCRLEIFEPWTQALQGLDKSTFLQVIYWLHLSRRDLVLQRRRSETEAHGTFALRSPVRPNPLGISTVKLVGIEGATVLVRGLDCVDQTPLIDIKPDRCQFSPTPDGTRID